MVMLCPHEVIYAVYDILFHSLEALSGARNDAYVSIEDTRIDYRTEPIIGLHPDNGRRRYKVTPSLIGWAQT